ncbi:MAG: hypothetical protein PVH13_04800 [Gammaproteobacteria bacterium]|jgi:hypothetical protein
MIVNQNYRRLALAWGLVVMLAASGCATAPSPDCRMSDTRALNAAIESAQDRLQQGCVAHFDGYMDQLLDVAAGDPDPDNKQAFSDFLVWAADTGLLSRRQAQETWNRYFNVKFVSLRGDYNNCAQTCPVRRQVMTDMEQELADKERGMLQAALDREGYYRADRLLSETELVLEATCRACEAGGR